MNNQEILKIAMRQSAIDSNAHAEDFVCSENKVVYSAPHGAARKYLTLPFSCDLVSYGTNIVASVNQQTEGIVRAYIDRFPEHSCFETPHMHILDDALQNMDLRICFMAEYFLPDVRELKALPCDYEIKTLFAADFETLYMPQWSNALCEDRKSLDVLGMAAYDNGQLIGLAGCSADCDTMWQIGVDVLPAYRRHSIACALTSRLAIEILNRQRVPFYCAAWSNIKSVRNAIRSGFRPAWVEMTAKSRDFVDTMNTPHP